MGRTAIVLVCWGMALAAGGCNLTEQTDWTSRQRSPQELRCVQAANFEAATTQPATTVEQAGDQMTREVLAPVQLPSMELDIATARAWALEDNLPLMVERVSPPIARQDLRAAEAVFEPSFRNLASFARDGAGDGRQDEYVIQPGLALPLKTGGEITGGVGAQWDDRESIDDSANADYSFSISQPLLRGAGVRVNTAPIRIAGLRWDITSARTKLAVIQTLAEVDRTYWALYAAREDLRVARQQYDLSQVQIEQARKRVAAGTAAPIEITRSQSGVATRLQAIITAQTLVRQRERQLKRLMNRPELPVSSDTELVPRTLPQPLGLKLDSTALLAQAREQRMELLVLELELAIDREIIGQRRNALLPGLDLTAVYGRHGIGEVFNQSLRLLNDESSARVLVEARLDVPLGNQAAQAGLRRARLERLQTLLSRRDQELAIEQDVEDALDSFYQNWQQIVVARQGVIVAAQNYQAERRQFEQGLRTSIDVLDAATRLALEQLNEIRALSNYEVARVDLAVATGTVLGEAQVCWDGIASPTYTQVGGAQPATAPAPATPAPVPTGPADEVTTHDALIDPPATQP